MSANGTVEITSAAAEMLRLENELAVVRQRNDHLVQLLRLTDVAMERVSGDVASLAGPRQPVSSIVANDEQGMKSMVVVFTDGSIARRIIGSLGWDWAETKPLPRTPAAIRAALDDAQYSIEVGLRDIEQGAFDGATVEDDAAVSPSSPSEGAFDDFATLQLRKLDAAAAVAERQLEQRRGVARR